MNETNNLIERLGLLQQTLNKACLEENNKISEKTIVSNEISNKIVKKRIIQKENSNKQLSKQFKNYLLEQKLIGTLEEIRLKKFLILWRKQLGRKILIRKAQLDEEEPKKDKNTKRVKPRKGSKKKGRKVQKKIVSESSDDSYEELVRYAAEMIEKKKKELRDYENHEGVEMQQERFHPDHDDIMELPDEESAMQSDDKHRIKNPFIIKNSMEFSDSDDEFLHTNENGVIVNSNSLKESSEFTSFNDDEEIYEPKNIEQKSKKTDIDEVDDIILDNKRLLKSTRASLLSMDRSVVFDINESQRTSIAKEIVNIPPDDDFNMYSSRKPAYISSSSSCESFSTPAIDSTSSSIKADSDETYRLIKRVHKAIDSKSSSDRFDSLIARAQTLLGNSSNPMDDLLTNPLYDDPYNTEMNCNQKDYYSNDYTSVKSAGSCSNRSSTQTASNTEIKNDSKSSSPVVSNNSSPASKISQESEHDAEIDSFDKRLSDLTNSKTGYVVDDDGEVVDTDHYIKSLYTNNNNSNCFNIDDSEDDIDTKDYELDNALASLKRTFGNTISGMASNTNSDSDDDFEERLNKLTLP